MNSLPEPGPQLYTYLDHLNFPKAIGSLVRDDPQFAGVTYSATFPKEAAKLPQIVYTLNSRVPGIEGKETYKPRLREEVLMQDGTIVQVWSQWQTCIYQFDVVTHTGEEADTIVFNLDWLIRNNVGAFLNMGAMNVVFEEQLQDALLASKTDMVTRSLRWRALLEQIEFRSEPGIQEVRLRCFLPQQEAVETKVRASSGDLDYLDQHYVAAMLTVADPSPSGVARHDDYVKDLDFELLYDPASHRGAIRWLEAGKRPDPGAAYQLRYLYWAPITTISIG